MLFARSDAGDDPLNDLWMASDDGRERKIVDVEAAFLDASAGGEELTEAEKARRERAREQADGIVTYTATPDCSIAAFVHGGGLWTVETASGELRQWAAADAPYDPRFDVSASRLAYVSGAELHVSDGENSRVLAGPTPDESNVSWGSADFVAAEEMGRSRGYWWKPDGSAMAVCRTDTTQVKQWWISAPVSPGQAPRPIRYPAAGTDNPSVELWIVDAETGPVRTVDWQHGGFEYLADVLWGDELLLVVQPRDQRSVSVLRVDQDTGHTEVILTWSDERWVELHPGTPVSSEQGLVMVVDTEVNRTIAVGEKVFDLGGLQVRALLAVENGEVLLTVTTDGTDSLRASTNIVTGEVRLLDEPGAMVSAASSSGTSWVTTAASDAMSETRIDWANGATSPVASNRADLGFRVEPTFHVVARRRLNAALCLPDGHDGSPLPVLMDPYGGPHAQRVLRSQGAFATSQWFAEQGYAVVVVDGRGTPGRGPAFEREVWGDLAAPVLEDQVDALQALAAERPELDLDRVAIRGWSFGGYLAALAVLRRPDVFHAAIAGAPVTDWLLYDTHYTERYLGHPQAYPEHYAQTDLLADASNLERPLLLVHGLADDNVVAAHTLSFSQALLEGGSAHEVLPLSGVTHMTPQEKVAENLLLHQLDFLKRALRPNVG